MSTLKNIIKSSYIIVLGGLLGKGLGLVNQSLLGRFLEPEGFGDLAVALTILQISSVIILLGTKTGLVKFISGYYEKSDKIGLSSLLCQSFIFVICSSTVVFLLSFFVLNYFFINKFSSCTMLLISFSVPAFAFVSYLQAILRGFGDTKYNTIAEELIKKIIRIIVFLSFFLILGLKIESAVLALLVALTVIILFKLYIINKFFYSFSQIIKNNKRKEIRGLLNYSLPLAFSSYILILFNYVDILSLSYFKSSADVGIYVAAFGISGLIGILPKSLTYKFFPSMSSLVHLNNKEELIDTFYSTLKLAFVFSLFAMFLIVSNGNLLINLIYGNAYFNSYQILILLSIGQFVIYATGPTGSMLNALGKTKQTMMCDISGGVINLLLNIPFVIYFGVIGVALSTSISIMSRNLLTLYFIKKNLNIQVFTKKYLTISILPFFSLFIICLLNFYFDLNYLFILFISIFIFFLSLYIIYINRFFNKNELDVLKEVFNSIIKFLKKERNFVKK